MLLKDKRVNPSNGRPNIRDNEPIRLASRNGHVSVVELLLKDKRVSPEAHNNFAIKRSF